jgi:hypothetical protein
MSMQPEEALSHAIIQNLPAPSVIFVFVEISSRVFPVQCLEFRLLVLGCLQLRLVDQDPGCERQNKEEHAATEQYDGDIQK